MASKVTAFAVSTDVAGTLVEVTTIGFRPSFVKFRTTGRASLVDIGPANSGNDNDSRGIALRNGKNYCWSKWAAQGADPYTAGAGLWNTACVVRQTGTGTTTGKFKVTRMLDTGFEYEILEQFGTAATINVEAYAGVETDAIEITEPGAIGVQTYSTPFRATYLEVLGSEEAAFDAPSGDAAVCFGAAFGPGEDQNAVWASWEASSLGTGATKVYCRRTECLAIINNTNVLVRARLEAFNETSVQLDWLERSGSRKFVLIVFTGQHYIAQGLTQTNTDPFQLTGMTWTPEAVEMVSAAIPENTQDTVYTAGGVAEGAGFSDGFGTGPAERAVLMTRLNFDGNTGVSRQTYQHEFDELYASASQASPPVQLGLCDINSAFALDTVELVMDDADPEQFYFFLIVHGPAIIASRARLVKYLQNTYQSREAGRTLIRDVLGRTVPNHDVKPDNFLFAGGPTFVSTRKYANLIVNPATFYLESVQPTEDRLKTETNREGLFQSVMRRLAG